MPYLSIIVPVYKVEAYLVKCIESILAQDFSDWELLLVDDGSPDGCPAICDSYAARDARIRVVHQKNSGVSTARNRGLELANGTYVTFVDSDDYLAPNCYSRMLEAMERHQADMAICGFLYEYPDGTTEPRSAEGGEVYLEHRELVRSEFDIPWSVRTVTYNKIFKREMLGYLRFREELSCSEDTFFLHEFLMNNVCSAVFVREPFYISFQRPGSAMHGGLSLKAIEDSLSIHKRIAEETRALYPELYAKAFSYYMDSCVWKMNANLQPPSALSAEARCAQRAWEKRIRCRIFREWWGVLHCSLIGWKQKIFYMLVALNLR